VISSTRIPIISLYGNLIVPIQGTVGDELLETLRVDVTARIDRDFATGLIIDISGVDLLDSYMTRSVRDLALMAKLMGVRTIISGAKPEIAITIVEMGLEIPGVESQLNLERALERLFVLAAAEGDDDVDDAMLAWMGDDDDLAAMERGDDLALV
jgi:rsbT antagonist protein RsbS